MEILDLPFPFPYTNSVEQALYHLDTELLPLFSLHQGHLEVVPLTESLPTSPVLSVPQYLDSIQHNLDAYSPLLQSKFETICKQYAPDVSPDPPSLRLKHGPQRPEDLKISEEQGSTLLWKKVYRLSPPQTVELKAQ